MQIETATLLAIASAPVAVLALVAALAVIILVRHGRRSLLRADTRLDRQETAIREELTTARGSLLRTASAIAVLRAHGTAMDADITTWTTDLVAQRAAIERVRRSRIGPAVRAMQWASALARVALLWRTPAR